MIIAIEIRQLHPRSNLIEMDIFMDGQVLTNMDGIKVHRNKVLAFIDRLSPDTVNGEEYSPGKAIALPHVR